VDLPPGFLPSLALAVPLGLPLAVAGCIRVAWLSALSSAT